MKNIQRGFTLIELLIVMAIIGILTTIAGVNFIGVRERARDTERKADMSQIQTGLEFYRTDTGTYPTELPACETALSDGTTIYMKETPCDPKDDNSYSYIPSSDSLDYTLATCLENENDKDKHVDITDPHTCRNGTVYYSVTSP